MHQKVGKGHVEQQFEPVTNTKNRKKLKKKRTRGWEMPRVWFGWGGKANTKKTFTRNYPGGGGGPSSA